MTDKEMAKILIKAGRCRLENGTAKTIREWYELVMTDVPALVAELRRLRACSKCGCQLLEVAPQCIRCPRVDL